MVPSAATAMAGSADWPRTDSGPVVQVCPPSVERATAMRDACRLAPGSAQATYTSPFGATVCEGRAPMVSRTFWLTGSLGGKPEARPTRTGRPHRRPPSRDRAAMICAGPVPPCPLATRKTLSSDPSRLTRIALFAGHEPPVRGSYKVRGADQVLPPSVVVD